MLFCAPLMKLYCSGMQKPHRKTQDLFVRRTTPRPGSTLRAAFYSACTLILHAFRGNVNVHIAQIRTSPPHAYIKKADRTSYVCLSCRFTASEAADGLCSIIFCAGETAVRVCRPGSEPVVCLFPQALHTADADDLKSTARQVFLRHGAFSPGQTSFAFFPNSLRISGRSRRGARKQ